MDKSGPRHTTLKSPLIERSDLQSPQQRTLYGALTLAFWAFWLYLWLPILALFAWLLGLQQAFKYMVVLKGYHAVVRLVGIYSLVILLMGSALLLWALYNIIRFHGVERRAAPQPVTPGDFGRDFNKNPESVERWQNEQRLYVTHDQNGCVARVEILSDGASVPI